MLKETADYSDAQFPEDHDELDAIQSFVYCHGKCYWDENEGLDPAENIVSFLYSCTLGEL